MIKLSDLSVSFDGKIVLDKISFEFEEGKKYAIMGESGIGKTTVLNAIAGLVAISNGSVKSNSDRISYVFQEPRLFEWLTVLDNVLLVMDSPLLNARERALGILEKLGLKDCVSMYPSELSGGMKQRLSLARAIAYSPDVLLMDEPFRALDEKTAQEVASYIFDVLKEKTVIFVTHDKNDLKYADCLITLKSSSNMEKSSTTIFE